MEEQWSLKKDRKEEKAKKTKELSELLVKAALIGLVFAPVLGLIGGFEAGVPVILLVIIFLLFSIRLRMDYE